LEAAETLKTKNADLEKQNKDLADSNQILADKIDDLKKTEPKPETSKAPSKEVKTFDKLPKNAEEAMLQNRKLRVELNKKTKTLEDFRKGWVDRETHNEISKRFRAKSDENRKLLQENAKLKADVEKTAKNSVTKDD